ncbi:hypothetical protein ACI2K4_14270 [Micromonospora sp. NPDC050397]|uniref:hypothetical protein n=1 Tax=Micromonospora sp. NPDC050397 TaxID=3364279 RepID=UPI00384D7319
MTLTLAVVGAVLVALAILGGGLRVGGVHVANLSRPRILLLASFGLVTMALGCYLELASTRPHPPGPTNVPVQAPATEAVQPR